MISFGIMTALLVALTLVVHYDLLGLFLPHPYGRRIVYTYNERHQYRPTSDFDHIWIPRPGTEPNTFYLLPRLLIVKDHGGDDEGYLTESNDDVSGSHNNRGTTGGRLSDEEAHQREPAPDTVVDRVPTITTIEVPDDRNYDNNDDNDDYVAPGQEWDNDVF